VSRLTGLAVTVLVAAALPAVNPGRAGTAASARGSTAVTVRLAGPVRPVTPWLLGLNGVNRTGPVWDDQSFDAVLRKFAPGVIRYPGGTAANYWDWQAGWFQPGNWPGKPGKRLDDTLAVFAAAIRASGATPLYDLNTVTYGGAIGSAALSSAMLGQQLEFLRAAAARGLPVRLVELGNELYLNGFRSNPPNPHDHDYAKRFPAAADYARQMNAWTSAIHHAFPGVSVAVVATDANDVGGLTVRRRTWNSQLLPLLRGENAVTVHENLRVYHRDTAADVLALPYLHFQHFEARELKLFSSYHLAVWITEFNMTDFTHGHIYQGTWLHGLFAAEEALLFLREPDITYVGLNATAGLSAAAIFAGARGFGSGGPPTVPLALTAAGTTLSMIQAAFGRASSAQPLAFTPALTLGTTGAPALLGEALATPSGRQVLLLNLSSRPVILRLGAVFPGRFTVTEVSAASAGTRVTGPSSTIVTSSSAATTITLRPYALADVRSG